MEVGQVNKLKVGAIIQARMSSSRLPGKTLMSLPLVEGKPILDWILSAIETSRVCHSVTVATSVDSSNDILEEYCKTNSVSIFRGSENDVLSRFQEVIKNEGLDVVIRLTADNPLIDSNLLDSTITKHIEEGNQYTKTTGLPLGMNFEIINADVLQYAGQEVSNLEKEHVTLKAAQSDDISKCVFNPTEWDMESIRLTIDYAADYLVVSQIIQILKDSNQSVSIENIRGVLIKYPWLADANAALWQKKQYQNPADEISAAHEMLMGLDMHQAAKILKG